MTITSFSRPEGEQSPPGRVSNSLGVKIFQPAYEYEINAWLHDNNVIVLDFQMVNDISGSIAAVIYKKEG